MFIPPQTLNNLKKKLRRAPSIVKHKILSTYCTYYLLQMGASVLLTWGKGIQKLVNNKNICTISVSFQIKLGSTQIHLFISQIL